MKSFSEWLSFGSKTPKAAGTVIQAFPGETLDQATERAEKASKGGQVTLKFNHMSIVYVNGQIRHDLSKLHR
jgi:hypothetical protein